MFKFLEDSWLGKIVRDTYNSFNTEKKGLSARKLTAFGAFALLAVEVDKHATADNIYDLAMLLVALILLCLGLVTIDKLLELKSGASSSITTTTKNNTEEIVKKEVIQAAEDNSI